MLSSHIQLIFTDKMDDCIMYCIKCQTIASKGEKKFSIIGITSAK